MSPITVMSPGLPVAVNVTLNESPGPVVASGVASSAGEASPPASTKIDAPPKLPSTVKVPPTATVPGSAVTMQPPGWSPSASGWATAAPAVMARIAVAAMSAAPDRAMNRERSMSPLLR